jgi:hypothetical protein
MKEAFTQSCVRCGVIRVDNESIMKPLVAEE